MKRILIALFTIFACGKTFAAGPMVPQAPIFVFADVLEYAIKKNFSVMDYDAVTQEWEKRMSADGTVTATDIEAVCKIGRLDKNACTKFRDDLMTYFYPICEKTATKGKSNCVDDFWATIHGTWVRLSEAIGIAQEYAQLKNKETVVCSPKTRQVNPPARASYLKCTSVDGGHYYEFKFNSTTETNDRDIISGTLRAVGKMHNIEFQNSDCTLERIASDSNCALAYKTSDIGQCEKINKSLKRFGYSSKIITTEKFGKRCEVFGITGGNRSAYGIDNTVFQDVQYVAGPEVENRIKAYVQKELSQQNIKLEKFSCDKTTKHDYTNVAMDGLVKKHSEILTCYVNGSPIDFLFANLSESGKRAKEAGLSKMACAQIGGKIDGRDCRGLDEMECAKVSHKIPGGTTWDKKAEVCILNKADLEKKTKDRIQILGGLVLAVGISAAIAPTLALSTTGETTYILLSGVGSVIVDQGFIQIERLEELKPAKYAYEFVTDALACNIPTGTTQCNRTEVACATDVVSKHFGRLDEIIDKLNDSQLTSVVEAMVNVTDCLSDEQLTTALKSITQSTNLKDKIINQAGTFWLAAGIFLSPENAVTKLASRAPRIAHVLGRCQVVDRVSDLLGGARYTRIYVDNLNTNQIRDMVSELRRSGAVVSSNIEQGTARRFIGVADRDIFGPWPSSNNWVMQMFSSFGGDLNLMKRTLNGYGYNISMDAVYNLTDLVNKWGGNHLISSYGEIDIHNLQSRMYELDTLFASQFNDELDVLGKIQTNNVTGILNDQSIPREYRDMLANYMNERKMAISYINNYFTAVNHSNGIGRLGTDLANYLQNMGIRPYSISNNFFQVNIRSGSQCTTGLKFHVSVAQGDIEKASFIVNDLVKKHDVADIWKVGLNGMGGSQLGKDFTIYVSPNGYNSTKIQNFLIELENNLKQSNIHPNGFGSNVISGDRAIPGSQYINYRYDRIDNTGIPIRSYNNNNGAYQFVAPRPEYGGDIMNGVRIR